MLMPTNTSLLKLVRKNSLGKDDLTNNSFIEHHNNFLPNSNFLNKMVSSTENTRATTNPTHGYKIPPTTLGIEVL